LAGEETVRKIPHHISLRMTFTHVTAHSLCPLDGGDEETCAGKEAGTSQRHEPGCYSAVQRHAAENGGPMAALGGFSAHEPGPSPWADRGTANYDADCDPAGMRSS
jgi:hypothetical protein